MQGIHSIIRTDFLKVQSTENIQETAEQMSLADTGFAVIEEESDIVGVFSEKDLINRVVAVGIEPSKTCIKDVMTQQLISVPISTSLQDAKEQMTLKKTRHLMVHDEQKKVFGLIHLFDVLELLDSAESTSSIDIERTLNTLNFKLVVNRKFLEEGLSALIVEDSVLLTKLIKKSLLELGFEKIETVDNGYKAIDRIKQGGKFDLLLYDWSAPKISGVKFLIEMSGLKGPLPYFLMLVDQGGASSILDAITFGADNYLMKPINTKKLHQRLMGKFRAKSQS